jgi:hypothetical protein
MKPKILLNPGTGWAGTTPFYYTLRDAKFCNAGYKKEFHYLKMMYLNDEDFTDWMLRRYTREGYIEHRSGKIIKITAEYNKEHYQALLEPEHSFEKYIYHMQYMRDMFPKYEAVCDFSNWVIDLPEDFLTAHANALKPHFDVRVTMLVADPVFRYYQELGGVINYYHREKKGKFDEKPIKNEDMLYIHYIRTKQQQKLFRYCIERSRFSTNCYYEDNIKKIKRSYGNKNVLVVEMEKFWNSSYHNESFDRLSEFLGYEISPNHLYPNQYMSEDKNIEGLRDQDTEIEPLTEELYDFGKKHL